MKKLFLLFLLCAIAMAIFAAQQGTPPGTYSAGSSGTGITYVAANPPTCTPGVSGLVELNTAPYTVSYCSAANTWTAINSSSSSGLPAGMIAYISAGSCPSGWTEVANAGDYVLLTQSANADVGTTGGSTSYTPAGSNATVSFTPAGTNAAASFTPAGTNATASFTPAGTNATASFTPAGTNATASFTPAGTVTAETFGTTKFTTSGSGTAAFTSVTGGHAFTGTGGTVPAETFTGTAGTVPAETFTGTSGTVPAEAFTGTSGTVPAETFTGTSGSVPGEAFTGTGATIQPTYLKLIACSKN